MTPDRFKDMASAYALGALDPDERKAFEARLAEDAELRALVAEYRETLGSVADAVAAPSPPPALRERILERARSTPQGTRPDDSGPRLGGSLAIAASVILAMGMGAWAWQLRDRAAELEGTVASLTTELVEIRGELVDAEAEVARYDSITSALIGSELRFATLTAPESEPRMHLVLNSEEDLVLVAAVNLAPAPPDRVYQLWGIREGEDPVSLGTFDSGPDNVALQTLSVPADQEFDLSAVSEEPAGGSPQPTTTPFLAGNWSPQGT